MLRFGAASYKTREMNIDDIFNARLKLLIVMAQAYLEHCALGDQRCRAMLENARHIEIESVALGNLADNALENNQESGETNQKNLFYKRIKLVAVMVKSIAKGFPIEETRKEVLRETLNDICSDLGYTNQVEAFFPFNVA